VVVQTRLVERLVGRPAASSSSGAAAHLLVERRLRNRTA
jgi:hypothetical protein